MKVGIFGDRPHATTYYSGSTFSPSDISGLKIWLKADSLVLSNNDPVTTWADSSGNSNDVTQGSAGAKPTYKTNIHNGKPSLSFDGGDSLANASLSATVSLNTGCTIFVVFSHTIGSSLGSWKYIQRIDSSVSGYLILCSPNGNAGGEDEAWVDVNGTTAARFTGLNDGVAHILGIKYSGTVATPYIDGTAGSTVSGTISNAANRLYIGSNNAGSENFNGYISEYIAYNSQLSDADRQSVEGYLRSKYGTP